MKTALCGVAAFALMLGASAQAQTTAAAVDAAAFGARPTVRSASLSPSGNAMVYIGSTGTSGEALYFVDLAGAKTPKRVLVSDEANTDLSSCEFVSETRLICTIFGRARDATTGKPVTIRRVLAVNTDGTDSAVVAGPKNLRGYSDDGGRMIALTSERGGGEVLFTRWIGEQQQVGTRLANAKSGLAVIAFDAVTGKERTVEPPNASAVAYYTDENGAIRMRANASRTETGYERGKQTFYYRPKGTDRWETLSAVSYDSQTVRGFEPVAIDSAADVAYGFDVDDSGLTNLYSVALDGSGAKTLVLRGEGVDVDSVVTLGRNARVVGASYATDRRRTVYFDPALKSLAAALGKSLPGNPGIYFGDTSADGSKILLYASSDTDPGQIYLFDRTAKTLNPLIALRDEVAERTLAPMKAISFTAADGTAIPAYLTLPVGSAGRNLPAIVMPHGGPSSRDEWGFDWLVQFFAARGYAVIQPNYRGSAGYGAEFFGQNGFRDWRKAIGDVNDAGRWLVAQGIADPAKLAGFGWSYGGYATLQSQVLDPALFKAVVAVAPVTDIRSMIESERDFASFRLTQAFFGDGPHVVEGSPAQNAGRFSAPVLLVHGTADQNVDVEQSRLMEKALKAAGKRVEYIEYPDLAHALNDSAARRQMLERSAQFLDAALQR